MEDKIFTEYSRWLIKKCKKENIKDVSIAIYDGQEEVIKAFDARYCDVSIKQEIDGEYWIVSDKRLNSTTKIKVMFDMIYGIENQPITIANKSFYNEFECEKENERNK